MADDGVSYPPLDPGLIPEPASSMPPGVSDMGARGTTVRYAREDHTHASKARKERKAVSSGAAASFLMTWVYPTPFGAGVVPIPVGIAEATGTTDSINVQVEGTPTNTQCVFRISRFSQTNVALLGLTILSLVAPGSINVACIALEP
ncbi:MAG: hypothetical protein EON59_08030 [Alphaproteobacteria bacterium]|nr:MAG: hypothetical protein EON59_08030 [Alphaproteobacteria bacterium]